MTTASRYVCQEARRRELVRAEREDQGRPPLNGVDYLELDGPRTLTVVLLHPLAGPAPGARVEGGARIRGIRVTDVTLTAPRRLRVAVDQGGDFSLYTLRLVRSAADDGAPDGFDPRLTAVSFSFKADCPSDFDCGAPVGAAAPTWPAPALDYLARDYGTFRRLLLDRLGLLLPGWTERSPADPLVMLAEVLAHVADQLAYYQDAVATEAYLGTARRRVSVRRHARLLDYRMHEGCNARAWVALEVDRELTLPAGTPVLTGGAQRGAVVAPDDLVEVLSTAAPEVFETMHPAALRPARNAVALYTWSDQACVLPAGATGATLEDVAGQDGASALGLAPGDVLILESLDGDLTRRHAVRLTAVAPPAGAPVALDPLTGTAVVEVEWGAEDALPAPLPLGGGKAAVARANVVLADHGLTQGPARVRLLRRGRTWRAALEPVVLTHAVPYDAAVSAAAALRPDPQAAVPVIALRGDGRDWVPRGDLLASAGTDPAFVVEVEESGAATLRFGDGVHGLAPSGAPMEARYRVGNGLRGAVGPEALSRVVWAGEGITSARNPLAAGGAADPEPLERARQLAASAFRRQERAVTAADYGAMAERHPEVQRASGRFRWTGSWYTAFVTVDRVAGLPVDDAFRAALLAELDGTRMAGHDLAVEGPVPVPVDLGLRACVKDGYFRGQVRAALRQALGSGTAGGAPGFFHPDHFTFGQPLYLSQIYAAAMAVAGVASVEVFRFQRLGRAASGELEGGVLATTGLEIVELADDPNFPEKGRLELVLAGGL